MVYTVCETTNLRATHYAERIWDGIATEDIENGTIGYLDGQSEEGGVIYNFVKGTKEGMRPVLVHMPEWTEDTSNRLNQRKDKFVNKEGISFRSKKIEHQQYGLQNVQRWLQGIHRSPYTQEACHTPVLHQ